MLDGYGDSGFYSFASTAPWPEQQENIGYRYTEPAQERIVCPYCASVQEKSSNCTQCGGPLGAPREERVRNVIVEVEKPVGLWAVIRHIFKR